MTLLPGTPSNPLIEAPRGGNLLDNFRKFGGGALVIAEAPPNVKANAQKIGLLEPTENDTFSPFASNFALVKNVVKEACIGLYELEKSGVKEVDKQELKRTMDARNVVTKFKLHAKVQRKLQVSL